MIVGGGLKLILSDIGKFTYNIEYYMNVYADRQREKMNKGLINICLEYINHTPTPPPAPSPVFVIHPTPPKAIHNSPLPSPVAGTSGDVNNSSSYTSNETSFRR